MSACSERKRVSLLLVRVSNQFRRSLGGCSNMTDNSMKCRSSHTMCIARLHQHSARVSSQRGLLHFWKALFASPNEMDSNAIWLQTRNPIATLCGVHRTVIRRSLRSLGRQLHACVDAAAGHRSLITWLILPVVICLFQRLSHACLSIRSCTAKLRMAHYNSYSLLDNRSLHGYP